MSWSDIFYPENAEKRVKLIRKSQEIVELMKNNFRETNNLTAVMKEHLGMSFSPIRLNEKATVKYNCDVLIERIHEIQTEVEKINKKLKTLLEPDLYEKLKRKELSVPESMKVSAALRVFKGCVACIASACIVGWLFQNLAFLASMTGVCAVIATGVLGVVVFGVLLVGIDVICESIRLEKALKEYDDVLADFRPASEQYQDRISGIKWAIKNAMSKNSSCYVP